MQKDELIALLRRLARAGLNRVPRKQREADALLALSLVGLEPEGIFDETGIDTHLKTWLAPLAGEGGVDHVTWRRALVDRQMLRRATDGAIYRLRRDGIAGKLSEDAAGVDASAIFAAAASVRPGAPPTRA
ncbi:MAG: DUF2087 domain-containing protein [Pseudomonadales bacterium]|nr:DUF2087 domain-containing protein [Pseudomonadales bacterium]